MSHARALPFLALLLVAAPLAAQPGAPASRWQTVLTGGDGTVVSIDSATIDRTGDSTFTVLTAIRFPQRVTLPSGEGVDREVDEEELDCGGGRTRPLASELYAGEAQVKGAALSGEWAAVAPGRRAVFDASCAWLLGGFAARLKRSYLLSQVEEMPQLVNRDAVTSMVSREYPRVQRAARQTGTVVLRFRVLENGTVDRPSVSVEDATHPDFAEAARRVIYTMRFTPARLHRIAVPVWVTLPVTFQIATGQGTSREPPGFPPPFPPLPPTPGRP